MEGLVETEISYSSYEDTIWDLALQPPLQSIAGLLETIGRPQTDHHSYNSLRWTSEIELNPAAATLASAAASRPATAPTKQPAAAPTSSKQSKRKLSPSSAMVSMAARLLSETRMRSGKG